MKNAKKVVLAYSGGLDTSIILKWLGDTYGCEVVTFTANIGQLDDLSQVKQKALNLGIKNENIFIEDLREDFAKNYIFPMFRANALYEGEYLLGTSIARPLITKKLIEIAKKTGADAISHGATGKGNDQVRFELGAYALNPNIKVIAPWREWDLNSREKLLKYAEKNGISIDKKPGKSPYSMDSNLLHISYEGLVLEDPNAKPESSMWRWTKDLKDSPNESEKIEISFENGDAVAINGKKLKAHEILQNLNELGAKHGIGRLDLVENRYVGMKSRGCYETPGGTILLKAHRAIEGLTLDSGAAHLKDEIMPKYASLIYNGFWFSPERLMLQALIDESQKHVSGDVRVELFKGNVIVTGRKSKDSLFNTDFSTFEEDNVFDQKDADGFIKLNALRFIIAGKNGRKLF